MVLKVGCYPLTLITHRSIGQVLQIKENSKAEETYFEQLHAHPNIIEIAPTSQNNGHGGKWLHTHIGKTNIFTAYLGEDYNGKISLENLTRYRREILSSLEIEHVCSIERLLERHLERIAKKELSWTRKLEQKAYHEYASLIDAYLDKF